MGSGCSCFARKSTVEQVVQAAITPRGRSVSLPELATRVLSRRKSQFSTQETDLETNLVEAIVIEQGSLIKTQHLIPSGATTNFAKLIVDAHTLSLKAIHSQQTCFGLIYKLCILQQVILKDRKVMADGVFMLGAQEAAMEVIEMIKLFSSRGWLARLSQTETKDEKEFARINANLHNLLGRQGCDISSLPCKGNYESSECSPTSGQLVWHMKRIGGLHTLAEKNRNDVKNVVSRLAPLLSVTSSAVAGLVEEEIKVAATLAIPSACNAIRHSDLRLLWWEFLQVEEVTWKEFWECFPEKIISGFGNGHCVGNPQKIKELLDTEQSQQTFETTVNKMGFGSHVTTIEIDSAFPPETTIEDSVRLLIRKTVGPMEEKMKSVENWVELQAKRNTLERSASSSSSTISIDEITFNVIKNRAGIPGEGMQIISRAEEIDRLIGMLKEGRRLVSIVGDCGAGKSAVATVVADRLMAKKFWHNAFYINLARVETVEAAAALICSAIGVPLFQSSPPCGVRLMNWLKSWGADYPNCAWVLDGIDRLVELESSRGPFFSLLTQALRHNQGLQLLVTCRNFPELLNAHRMEEVVHLPTLSEIQTRAIVEGVLGGALLPGEAHYLAAACEGNPLGVRLAGGCTAAGVCSALSLMTKLREANKANVLDLTSEGCSALLHKLALECINGLSAGDQRDLLLLTVCPAEFTTGHAAAALDKVQQPLLVWSLLWRLMMRGFLRFIPANGTYRLEDALVVVLQRMLGDTGNQRRRSSFIRSPDGDAATVDTDAAKAGIVQYYFSLLQRILIVHKSGAHLSALRMLEQERLGITQFLLRLSSESAVRMSYAQGGDTQIVEFVETLCEFQAELGIHFLTKEQQSAVVEAVFMLLESPHMQRKKETMCSARLWLVHALLAMGENVESGEVMTNVLEVLDSIENKDSITFQAVHAKSIVCQARIKHSGGVLKEAEELYKKGLEMQINILGNESDEVSITLSHLATVQQLLAKLPEAEKTYISSLRIQKKHSERNVAAVTTLLHNLASLHHQQGDGDEAERLYLKSLSLREQFIGHVNMEVASSMGSLAAVKVAKHEYSEGENLYRKAIVVLKEILGEAHIAVASMSTKLAVLLECHGAVEEAGELYVDALEVKERALGSVHDQVRKMVIRIQRVIGKSGHPIFPNGESSQPSMETDLHHWREYFTEIMMKREQHSEDEFKTQSGGRITPGDDAGTEWVTATSGGAQTATDLFATAHSLGTIFYDSKSSPSPANPASPLRRPFAMQNGLRAADLRSSCGRSPSPTNKGAPLRTTLTGNLNRVKASDRYKLPPSPLRNTSSAKVLLSAPISGESDKPEFRTSSPDTGTIPVTRVPRRSSDPVKVQDPRFRMHSGRRSHFEDRWVTAGTSPISPQRVWRFKCGLVSRSRVRSRSSSDADDPPHLDTSQQLETLELERVKQQEEIGPDGVVVCVGRDTSDLDFAVPIPMGWNELDADKDRTKIDSKNLEQVKLKTPAVEDRAIKCIVKDVYDIESHDSSTKSWASIERYKSSPDHEDPADTLVNNSAFLTLTVEQDLLESTNLYPEQKGALQSIVNPLYAEQTETLRDDYLRIPDNIVNTHASFNL